MIHTATGTTPYQAWFNRVQDYTDMRIFGGHVYVVDTDITRQKLDMRTAVLQVWLVDNKIKWLK